MDINLPGLESTDNAKEINRLVPCPRPKCGQLGRVWARYVETARSRYIATTCPSCGLSYSLSILIHGSQLGVKASPKPKRNKRQQPNDYELFAKFGWVCVYHEGNREAQEYRLRQLEQFSVSNPRPPSLFDGDDELTTILGVRASSSYSVAPENLFGLVMDHLIPVWLQDALVDVLTESQKQLTGQEWIVSGCVKCNEQRKRQLESTDKLLFIYSRFLMPLRGRSPLDRIQDAIAFASVLEKVEDYRASVGEEALRPGRRLA